jgi:hypothetical protein
MVLANDGDAPIPAVHGAAIEPLKVDPKPSSNHADTLAAPVVTRGFPW